MQETEFIWLNGKLVKWQEANVHFLTHALHYGSAVFEGIRCYSTPRGPAIFRLQDHINRLFFSARAFHMKIDYAKEQIINAVLETVRKNKLQEGYIRPLFFYGTGMGMSPLGVPVNAGIACWPWGAYLGKEGTEKGVHLKISHWVRAPRSIMPTDAKVSGNYVNSIMAKVDALETGFEDAILLDQNKNVAEATGENVFIVKNSGLITPTLENSLDGITRRTIIEIAKDSSIKFREEQFDCETLYDADEVFLTGTAAEVVPVREIDDRQIGDGKPGLVTKKMQKSYQDAVHGKTAKWRKWLEFV